MHELYFISSCLIIGVGSGFLGGLLGIGGGVVIVPALLLLYAITERIPESWQMVVAVGTSLASIGFTSASAAWAQHRAGYVDWTLFRRLVVYFAAGSFLAGFLAPLLPPDGYRLFIGLFLAFAGIVMLTNWKPAPERRLPGPLGTGLIGVAGGNIAGLAGIAGGNVIVPTLVYYNIPVHAATATSSAMGVPIALVGAIGFFTAGTTMAPDTTSGFIDWLAMAPIVAGALVAAPLGVRTAHKLDAARLKRAFGILLLFVSVRLAWTALGSS